MTQQTVPLTDLEKINNELDENLNYLVVLVIKRLTQLLIL